MPIEEGIIEKVEFVVVNRKAMKEMKEKIRSMSETIKVDPATVINALPIYRQRHILLELIDDIALTEKDITEEDKRIMREMYAVVNKFTQYRYPLPDCLKP